MSVVYKNATDMILVISDLNVKFQPNGTKGDTVDLSALFTAEAIQASADLKRAESKKMIAPIKGMVAKPAKRTVQNPPNPGKYYIRKPTFRPKLTEVTPGKMAVVYNRASRSVVSPGSQPRKANLNSISHHPSQPPVRTAKIPNLPKPEQKTMFIKPAAEPACGETDERKVPFVECKPPPPVETKQEPSQKGTVQTETGSTITALSAIDPEVCQHVKKNGKQCKNKKQENSEFCRLHNPVD